MATFDFPILGMSFMPDISGGVYPSRIASELIMSNPKDQGCVTMVFPTSGDTGFSVSFPVPQNYVGSPQLVIKGILEGTPANVLAFGAQQLSREDSEAIDIAYETEDLAENSTWTGYADEDQYEEIITLTPAAAYVVGDTIYLWFFRDDDQDTTTMQFHLTDLIFRYSDT